MWNVKMCPSFGRGRVQMESLYQGDHNKGNRLFHFHIYTFPGLRPGHIHTLSSPRYIPLHRQAVLQAAGEGHFVGIFEFTAEGDAAGNSRNLHREGLDLFLDVIDSGVALDVGIEREDQFGCRFFLDAVHQRLDRQLIGADAVQRGNDAAEYMVQSVVLLGALNGDHIADGFHYADKILAAHAVGTNAADIAIGYIEATITKFDLPAHPRHYFAKMLHLTHLLAQ
jgi:hypothetical protein